MAKEPKLPDGLDISRLFGELAAIVQDHPEAGLDDIRREMPQLIDVDDDTLTEWVEAARVQGIE